ncbi:outer membrane transport energization protein TonB [Dongia mobilis]|uniref:Outer membrane transport energization protein TonB n=2 Tax=Dongia mobilis TaxID=578943 RepID=A0A4R6WQQ1_9PROT|nr:outer membrane transport energization protein TonB [Dongia mobilis]
MRCPALSVERRRHRLGRWLGAAVLIFGIHVSGAALGMMQWREPAGVPAPLPAAIMIDLAPVAATPPPPPPTASPDRAALVEEPDAIPPESVELPPLAELLELPPPLPEIEPEVAVPAKTEHKKEQKKSAEKKGKQKADKQSADKNRTEITKMDQAVAAAKIAADEAQEKAFKTAGEAMSETRAEVTQPEQQAGLPAGSRSTAPGAAASGAADSGAADLATSQAAQASWEGLVLSHIERFKKYPRVAKRRNQEGMPVVAFVIDRAGNIKNAYLVQSSGHDSLDEEAMATLRRAEPLPALPPEMAGTTVTRSVPIRFNLKD